MKIENLKYLEIPYFIFLLVVSSALIFGFPHLQAICILLIVIGFTLSLFGGCFFFAQAMGSTVEFMVSRGDISKNININSSRLINGSFNFLLDKLLNRNKASESKTERRYRTYFILGLILLILGLMSTFTFDYLNLI